MLGRVMKQSLLAMSRATLPCARVSQQAQSPALWTSHAAGGIQPSQRITRVRCQDLKRSDYGTASCQTTQRLPKKKLRLDELCMEQFPQYSLTMIQSWILQGASMNLLNYFFDMILFTHQIVILSEPLV